MTHFIRQPFKAAALPGQESQKEQKKFGVVYVLQDVQNGEQKRPKAFMYLSLHGKLVERSYAKAASDVATSLQGFTLEQIYEMGYTIGEYVDDEFTEMAAANITPGDIIQAPSGDIQPLIVAQVSDQVNPGNLPKMLIVSYFRFNGAKGAFTISPSTKIPIRKAMPGAVYQPIPRYSQA